MHAVSADHDLSSLVAQTYSISSGFPTLQLLEVLLPLLEQLAQEDDVRPVLRAKFGMAEWFHQRGFAIDDSKS